MSPVTRPDPGRPIPGTQIVPGRLALGAFTFGDQVEGTEADRMVGAALDAGVTVFDTADNYHDGASEEILGKILGSRRDQVCLATKCGKLRRDGDTEEGLSGPAILRAVDESLERLRTDHVDLLYLHAPDPSTPIEETLEALDGLHRQGKVLAFGQSKYTAWQIAEMHHLSRVHGFPQVVVSQQMYNPLARRLEGEYASCSERFGLFNFVYNPLAGGLLTGKHDPRSAPDPGTRFGGQARGEAYRRRYWDEDLFAAVEELSGCADDAGLSLIELTFAWLLTRPLVDTVLLGASSLSQLEQNLAAARTPAPDEQVLARMDGIWERVRGAAPEYYR